MTIEIEKNQVIPATIQNLGRRERYPWSKMEVGDSFFIPDGNRSRIAGAASHAARRLGRKFVVRSVDGGVRAWRSE